MGVPGPGIRAINDARKFHMKVVGSSATIVPLIQLCVSFGIALMVVLKASQLRAPPAPRACRSNTAPTCRKRKRC